MIDPHANGNATASIITPATLLTARSSVRTATGWQDTALLQDRCFTPCTSSRSSAVWGFSPMNITKWRKGSMRGAFTFQADSPLPWNSKMVLSMPSGDCKDEG